VKGTYYGVVKELYKVIYYMGSLDAEENACRKWEKTDVMYEYGFL